MSSIIGALNEVVALGKLPAAGDPAREEVFIVHPLITALTVEPLTAKAFANPAAGTHLSVVAHVAAGGAASVSAIGSEPAGGTTSLFGNPAVAPQLAGLDANATLGAHAANVAAEMAHETTAALVYLGHVSTAAAAAGGSAVSVPAFPDAAPVTVRAEGATVTFTTPEGLSKMEFGGSHHTP